MTYRSESYSISIASSENGTVVADRTSAPAGKTITLTATPNTGYALKSFSVTYGGKEVEVTDNSFVMPEGDVVISSIFEHKITVAETENGTVSASATLAQAGETITLTITPNSNYALQTLSVTCGGNEVEVTDNSFVMPKGEVIISAIFEITTGTENGHDWVDLGLPSGLKWATCNVGATKLEDYGDYYAWGEIATKTTYTWENYTLANGSSTTLTKYNNSSSYGTVDNKTTLEAADDVATQKWGGNWRMPTKDEWQELIDNCTWTWITLNGKNGYEVKASNGNSIFLPAAGCRYDNVLCNAGSYGYYWSSSLYTDNPDGAQDVDFNSYYHDTYDIDRYYGRSVRPVVAE